MDTIETTIDAMSLRQKVGQLFTIGFCGGELTPEVIEIVTRLHVGGLRVSPNIRASFSKYKKVADTGQAVGGAAVKRDPLPAATPHHSPQDLRRTIRSLQEMAVHRPCGVPLHIAVDCEGGSSADISRGVPLFPSLMGLACADDPDVFYRVHKVLGRILRAIGVNMIHSPVLDVVENAVSPEINTRSCSYDPEKVAAFGAAILRALQEEKVIATAKHFPGRGYSTKDVHYEPDACHSGFDEMMKCALLPYARCIPKGLPALMLAHSSYPGLAGGDETPATISERIVRGVLRERLGFNGVVTTDSITMEAILERYSVGEACAKAIQAGCDLVLYKTILPGEADEAIGTVVEKVECGDIPAKRVDESVRRILTMKEQYGLFDGGWRTEDVALTALLGDVASWQLARQTANQATLLIRDRNRRLPVASGRRILVVEQAMFLSQFTNDHAYHPYLLWENIQKRCPGAGLVRLGMFGSDDDLKNVLAKTGDYDVIVATNTYSRGSAPNTGFLAKLIPRIKRDVIVVTNSPFPVVVADCMDTVLCIFSEMPEGIRAASDVIAGALKPVARSPLEGLASSACVTAG